ncbi:MAG TPA: hypothetical protein VF040_15360 [Ktedonobacterales bacterium]
MAILPAPGTGFATDMGTSTTPLVVLFERDDTIAVPLLSQLRMTGYDVRAARTPVELFGMLGKQLVALVLVDLGNATAGRREFWVALDAQRRGRSLQVMTFRFISPANALDPDFDPAARALADVEVRGIHEFQRVLDAVRQRIPLGGALPGVGTPGSIPPLGAALGLPAPLGQQSSSPFSQPSVPPYSSHPQHAQPSPFAQPLNSSPFAQPVSANPFSGGQSDSNSPFAQPYDVNPFAGNGTAAPSNPFGRPAQAEPIGFRQPEMQQFGALEQAHHIQQESYGQNRQYGHQPSSSPYSASPVSQNGHDDQQIVDVWIPPDEDDQVTSIVPEATFQQIERQQSQASQFRRIDAGPQELTQRIPAMPRGNGGGYPGIPDGYTGTPTERALSTVLVEGSMLTEQKLEALRGIQQMLTGVGMQFKLGELALLFKFLSPDQLLAALLVSRGLVTPQQIASLGRIKQELAATGKDEDLASLLLKFQVLSAEKLRALQGEL